MSRIEVIGNATLYLGDCREILPTLPKVDAVVTDPPYGIDYKPQNLKKYDGTKSEWKPIQGDESEMDFSFLFTIEAEKIIWGAENFYSQLPHRGRWICWNKRSPSVRPNVMPSGDIELAWHDKTSGLYKYINIVHGGVVNANSINGNNERRSHPTEKPISLMEFCILQLKSQHETICDPFMGSGTTGVAAYNLGRRFIGIEREPKYFDIACKRIEDAQRQGDFFVENAA